MAVNMRTSSLQFKLLAVVAIAFAIALAASVFALTRVYGSIQDLDKISREDFSTQIALSQARVAFKDQVQEWKNLLLRGSDEKLFEAHWAGFEKRERDVGNLVREARATLRNKDAIAKLEQFTQGHKAAGGAFRKGLEAFKQFGNDPWSGDKAVGEVDRPLVVMLDEAERMVQDSGAKSVGEAVKSAEAGYWLAILGTVLVMVTSLVIMFFLLRRAIVSPIQDAMHFAGRIEDGDLTVELRGKSNDEIGQLMHSMQRMKNAIVEVVSQVRHSADAVVVASGQVSSGTTDLSQRTEEQASSLEETAASMEELASTVKQNADNARQADELARNASKRAEQGGAEVVRVVNTMTEISDSAKKIADIISVIDAIAFQTNILALNAAVEAARAGEQGRGFAVVASEVRSLAQRSAQAAKEIKQLIGNSVDKVENGTRIVEQAGDTIQALVIDVQRVSSLMASIAEASEEQSRGVQQVNKTVTEMDKVVQQNAAVVQQSSAAAEGMRHQADALVRAVSTFRLTQEEPAAVAHMATKTAAAARIAQQHAVGTQAPKMPARKATAAVPATVGDDWEEF